MAKYTGIIVLDDGTVESNITTENYIRVRIPTLHGPSNVSDYSESNVPENLRYYTEDDNLPYAHVLRPLDSTGVINPRQYFQNGDIVLVESINDDLNNLLITGKLSDYTATSDKQVIQNRIDGVPTFYSGGYSTDGSDTPAFQYGASLISVAKKELGVHEKGFTNKVKYNDELWNGNAWAWCCTFVCWCFIHAGLSQYCNGGKPTAGCEVLRQYHNTAGDSVNSNYKAGDILFMNFSGGSNAAHVGIAIEDQKGNKIKTIEGNTSSVETEQTNGGQVMEKNRDISKIVGGFRPGKSMDAEYWCFTFFTTTLGLNTAASCGILANIFCESNFNYAQPPVKDSNGLYAYGLCMWNGDRYNGPTGLINWCNSNDLDYTSLIGQLKFLEHELTGYTDMMNEFRNLPNDAQGAFKAGHDYCEIFERPLQVTYFSNKIDYDKSKLKLKALRTKDTFVQKYSPIYIYDYRGKIAQDKYWAKYKDKPIINS